MKKTRIELNDLEIETINGGNTEKDDGDEPRYSVGSRVDVYNTPLHLTTSARTVKKAIRDAGGLWHYLTGPADGSNGRIRLCTADRIGNR